MRVKIELPNIDRNLKTAIEELRKELDVIGLEMSREIIDILESKGKRASGELIRSVEKEVALTIRGLELTVGPSDPSGKWVDEGLMPGKMRPIRPLKRWARLKFGAAQEAPMAYAARRSIFKRGVEPTNFLRRTLDLFMPTIANRLARRVANAIND